MTTQGPDSTSTLYYAIALAAALHGGLIMGLSFNLPKPPPLALEQRLEITVVRPNPDAAPPEEPRFLAAANQEASGNQEAVAKPTVSPPMEAAITPETPVQEAPEPEPDPGAEPVEASETEPRIVEEAPQAEAQPQEIDPGKAARKPRLNARQLLANLDQEIRNLSAELDYRTELYAERPRRKAISASTKEHLFASYLEAWRRKVENVGNLNYPQEARRNNLYGSLVLHVALRADGSVMSVRVVRSSGEPILDEAAVSIVRLAAPYAPFPPAIREQVDILDITRTWQFLRGNRLMSR